MKKNIVLQIIHSCKEAELPDPEIKEEEFGGIMVTYSRTDIPEDELKKMGLKC